MSRFELAGIALALLAPAALANNGSGSQETTDDLKTVPAQDDAIKMTFKPGKGVTFDGGDKFKLRMLGGLIFKYTYASPESNIGNASPINTFDVRSARLIMTGHVFDPKTRYLFSIEAAHDKNAVVKDVWIDREVVTTDSMNLKLRLGQQKTLFSREFGPNYTKPMGEFTIAMRAFAMQRSRGLNAIFAMMDDRLRLNAGIWNRDIAPGSTYANEDGANSDNELNYSLGFRWDPNGSMKDILFTTMDLKRSEKFLWGIGGGVFFGNANVGNVPTGTDVEALRYNLNFAFKTKGFGGLLDYYGSSQELDAPGAQSVEDSGISAILNYSFESGWTLGGQFSMIDNGATQTNNTGVRLRGPLNPNGIVYSGEGSTTEFGIFGSRDFSKGGTHRMIVELINQKVKQDTTGLSDNNMIFRATYVLVF